MNLVRVDPRPYRRIAQENWGLTDEQMKGKHVHHRIPKSEGGTDDPSNLFVCSPWFHARVWHGTDSYHPMIVWATQNGRKGGEARAETDFRQSPEARAKMSKTRKGVPKSESHKLAISKAKKGKTPVFTPETWAIKLEKDRRPQPKAQCPHCGLIGGASAMTRYHFDNCQHKH